MQTLGDLLAKKREARKISLEQASSDLLIKKEQLKALETADWPKLPETTFVTGFIKSYAQYLHLDPQLALALYRREFDPKAVPVKKLNSRKLKRVLITPQRLINLGFIFIVAVFVIYLFAQYTSVLKSPKLQVFTPSEDLTTTVPAILITGQTEKETTISVNGEFAAIDQDGKFSYQLKLEDGQNIIEIIAAKRLSPKTKITRIVRLSR